MNNEKIIKLPKQVEAITEQLDNIAQKKLDKNGIVNMANMGQDVKQAMTGGSVAVVGNNMILNGNIVDNQIGLSKLANVKKSSNLYNKKTTIDKYKLDNNNNGTLIADNGYQTCDYIKIIPNNKYFVKFAIFISYYDVDKKFISGATVGNNLIITAPSNAHFIRISWGSFDTGVQIVNLGETEVAYEPFYEYIKKEAIDPSLININNLNITKRGGKNYFNKNDIIENVGFDIVNNKLVDSKTSCISSWIYLNDLVNDYAFNNIDNVIWYDKDKNIVSSNSFAGVTISKPSNATFMRVTVKNINKDIAQIEEGNKRTTYEPYKLIIDDNYLPTQEVPITPTSNFAEDVLARKAIIEDRAIRNIPNAQTTLDIPTYVPTSVTGYTDVTHPNVIYFENGWNGYKFWMVFTPYPEGKNNKYENPSIVASNDNVTWEVPNGLTNPVAPLEPTDTFQSDPEILMKGNVMELWYRASIYNSTANYVHNFYRKTSTDGVNWSARELMFNCTTANEILSPAMLYEDGKYKMWAVRQGKIIYGESVSGKDFIFRDLSIDLDKDFFFWHLDVLKHSDGKIEIVSSAKTTNQSDWSIFYTYSYDNEEFAPASLLIKPTSTSGLWDSRTGLYKPSLIMVGDEYYLYYATPQKIGLTTGKSMLELGFKKKVSYDSFDIKTIRTDRDSFNKDDTFDKYPKFAIIYTAIWAGGNSTWDNKSGIVKTENIYGEANKTRQFFYEQGKNKILMRTATSTGWTDFVDITII